MTMAWLLPLSLACVIFGIILSVLEEWRKSGLTDTSFTTLIAWTIGLIGLAFYGLLEHAQLASLIAFLPAMLFVYWILLKLKDRRRRA